MLRTTRALAGLALVTAGAMLLTERLGGATRAAQGTARWWPTALIVLAAAQALTFVGPPFPRGAGRAVPLTLVALAGIALAAGVVLLVTTGSLPKGLPRLLPALLLIGVGAAIAVIQPSPDRRYQNWVAVSAVLRRARLQSHGRSLQLVSARAVMGQAALDLSKCTVRAQGAEVHGTVFGGSIVLRLPAGWEITRYHAPDPTLEIIVPPLDAGLRTGPVGQLAISLTGIRGRLQVEWADAPAHPQPGPNTAVVDCCGP